jgi:hypothetical protein
MNVATRSTPARGELNSLAATAGIDSFQSLPSIRLFEILSAEHNYSRLCRLRNRRGKRKERDAPQDVPTSAKRQRNRFFVDPIMLDRRRCDSATFQFRRPNGLIVRYNARSLATYLLTSGNFFEPETRIEFTDSDLKRLDTQIRALGMSLGSVYDAKSKPESKQQQQIKDSRFKQDALIGLERCCGEIVVEMLKLVENDCDEEVAQIMLLTVLFPQFADLCMQMRASDPKFALSTIRNFQIWLKGPPNRPTEDKHGLLQVCIDAMVAQQQIIENTLRQE